VTRRRFWLAASAVALLAGAAGYLLQTWRGAAPEPANPAAVTALIAARLPDVAGASRSVEDWRGQVLVVNFWATWCAPCREEIPEFIRLQERFRGKGLQFVGISIDQAANVEKFAKELGVNYPLLLGGVETLALLREAGNRAGVLPYTLILDRQGNVAARHAGALKEATLLPLLVPLF